jgi:hypothetical protein
MTATATSAPIAALPDGTRPPGDRDLARVLQSAHKLIADVTQRLRATHPEIAPEWRFSPIVGWHQIYLRRKRRIFYLVPIRGDFRLSLILGGKALDALQRGPFADRVGRLLPLAKRYPEGTAFSFTRGGFAPEVVVAMLEAKIAH